MGYTRFVIVTEQRTGSTLLQALLDSHNHILSFGELFNQAPAIRKKASNEFQPLTADDDPIDFLEHRVFQEYAAHIKAVGFRLFYTHARQGKWQAVWDYLRQSRLKVIHLRRSNLLDRYLSLQLAYRSKQWVSFQGDADPAYSQPLTLNISECLKDFREMERLQNQAVNFFKDNPTLEVVYETLVAHPREECNRIQSFLDVDIHDLSTNTAKQQTKSRAEVIANFDQLKEQLTLGVSRGWAKPEWLEFLAQPEG